MVAHSYNTRVGEEELSELDTEDSTQSAGKTNKHTSQEQQESQGVPEETAVRCVAHFHHTYLQIVTCCSVNSSKSNH